LVEWRAGGALCRNPGPKLFIECLRAADRISPACTGPNLIKQPGKYELADLVCLYRAVPRGGP